MDYKLLLVDDEEGIRKVLGIALADMGYQVESAADGAAGLSLFKKQRPDIVITDIKMPVMDGVTLLQQIKRISPDTEVIMLTGHGDMDLAIQCLKLAATDFVTKPIDDDVLEIALRRADERIRMRRQLKDYTENLERMVAEKSAQLVAVERRAAVGQALEGMTAAMRNIAGDLDSGLSYFNDLPCYVSIHSPDLTVVAANQRYVEKLGDPAGRASTAAYKDAASPVPGTFESGKGQRTTAEMVLGDGSETTVVVHTAPIRDARGRVELVVEIAADVTEIRRLQEDLRTARHRYRQLFSEAPCYITVQDRQLRITEANRLFREDFGGNDQPHCHQVYRQRPDACEDCPVLKTFEDGQPHRREMEVAGPKGGARQMLVQTAPIRDINGRITHVMEMSTDVTEVRRLQAQLASLGLMVGSVSHGIKGLLTGLDGSMYLMSRGVQRFDKDQIQQGWESLRDIVKRVRRLVADILFYAREKELKWQQVDVRQFIGEFAEQVRTKTEANAIALEVTVDRTLTTSTVDPGMMRAILANLVDNAVDACLADTDKDKQHKIALRVHEENGELIFQVLDNGPGMDEEFQARLFSKPVASRKKAGSGLGLFIAGQILKVNNGRISVSSTPGSGACFTIRLPAGVPADMSSNQGENDQ